jgi:thiamine biosynthesis protein ThiI
MESLFLIKYGEISLKGNNRAFFLKKLQSNIRQQLGRIPFEMMYRSGRLFLKLRDRDAKKAESVLSRVFGIVSFSRALKTQKDMELIKEAALDLGGRLTARGKTFKIEARRTDKSFHLNSYEIACVLGDTLREKIPDLKVNLSHPEWIIRVEIRESAYLYGSEIKGPGGLPAGCSGRGLLLLSGGIDSPVAGYLMARRGLRIDCVYFHTPPYTAESVREKVETLVGILFSYLPSVELYVVPYTDIQLKIKQEAKSEELTLLSRACMMDIASTIAKRSRALCLITGESLGQVASQTLHSMTFTQSQSRLPVVRPLIGMDKEEIIGIAKRIGTYETSILPYPDCCTLFAPLHPLTHPRAEVMIETYRGLKLRSMVREAAGNAEVVRFNSESESI